MEILSANVDKCSGQKSMAENCCTRCKGVQGSGEVFTKQGVYVFMQVGTVFIPTEDKEI